MNDSTRHSLNETLLHETLLHDALHAHVQESGGAAAGPCLVGLADDALRVARRRQRLARAGIGIVAAAAVATAWVTVADGAPQRAHVVQPAGEGTRGTEKVDLISILPVTSSTEHACTDGSGGYTVHASATYPAFCVRADRASGMTDVRVASAKAVKSVADGSWQVEVTLGPDDRTRFAALTGSIAAAPAPRNEFAIVIDGKLWGKPAVTSSITGGRLEIVGAYVGDLTSATAHDLALRLNIGK
ncbi:SecDF P1 head subdomain-containing protein [Streptomyces sp. NPDC092369]|uniref:SecDF P1 head subdomain-containing protein n=1 Tax=Streptomyces sp. NPDC092369 TaxID=3366015 RepID=UPI00382EB4B5